MSNLKFTLFVADSDVSGMGYSLMARVFDPQSLLAVHRAIQSGSFGHYSKKRYFLVPLAEVQQADSLREYESERPFCTMKRELQMYPKGGRELSAGVLALFSNDALAY